MLAKTRRIYFSVCLTLLSIVAVGNAEIHIRLNQVGYLPEDPKKAIIISDTPLYGSSFQIKDQNNETVYTGYLSFDFGVYMNFHHHYHASFSDLKQRGRFRVFVDGKASPEFAISSTIYIPVTNKVLEFYKMQRCGLTDPEHHEPCHLQDATRVVNKPEGWGKVNVTGGWHDAGDYTKFLNTIAYTSYLMLLTYSYHDNFFFDRDGNDIPDLLDEAKIGLDWLIRAHYRPDRLIIQVQNRNDQTVGFRLPSKDPLVGDRPAYDYPAKTHCGLAAAALALGSQIFKKIGQEQFAFLCRQHAVQLWKLTDKDIPDFSAGPDGIYKDSHSWDNLALGAIEMYRLTGDKDYLKKSIKHARSHKPVSWVSWGDVGGLAYARIAPYEPDIIARMEKMLEDFNGISILDPFGYPLSSIPWGSASIQMGVSMIALLHKDITGSDKYYPLAVAQRDFLLGANSHGVSLIGYVGGTFAKYFHHQVAIIKSIPLEGALASGFVAKATHDNARISLQLPDKFQRFQHEMAVYFDDPHDYMCNEATISNNAVSLFVMAWFSDPDTVD